MILQNCRSRVNRLFIPVNVRREGTGVGVLQKSQTTEPGEVTTASRSIRRGASELVAVLGEEAVHRGAAGIAELQEQGRG